MRESSRNESTISHAMLGAMERRKGEICGLSFPSIVWEKNHRPTWLPNPVAGPVHEWSHKNRNTSRSLIFTFSGQQISKLATKLPRLPVSTSKGFGFHCSRAGTRLQTCQRTNELEMTTIMPLLKHLRRLARGPFDRQGVEALQVLLGTSSHEFATCVRYLTIPKERSDDSGQLCLLSPLTFPWSPSEGKISRRPILAQAITISREAVNQPSL